MKKLGDLFNPKIVFGLLIVGVVVWIILKFKKSNQISPIESIAESQFEAMRNYGTDEVLLFESLKNLNSSDLRGVYNSFGSRTYTSGGKGINIFNLSIVGNPLDLFGWYSAELNEKERIEMRKIWVKSRLKLTF